MADQRIMSRIVFLNPYDPKAISGGIKVTYQHAGMLAKLGHDVSVFQPAGKPDWLDVSNRVTVCDQFEPVEGGLIVFPETLKDFMLDLARTPLPGTKIMFCQNQFYLYSFRLNGNELKEMGFEHFIVPGPETARSLSSVLGLDNIHVIPNSVDTNLFYPRTKQLCIATNPGKWPAAKGNSALANLIATMLHLKYPHTKDVPWIALEDRPQYEVAEAMGIAPVFLALSRQEAFPLTPLEAMASRCAVVGLQGTGGKDYATPFNGHWFSPEQCEEIVDCIATLLFDISHGAPHVDRMLDAAEKTAKQYSVNGTFQAVAQVYGDILARSAA